MSAPRTPAVADPVVVPAGTTAADAVAAAGLPATGPKAIVVVRDPAGRLRDLDWAPELDTEVDAGARSTRRTGSTCCATRPRTCSPRPCRTSSRRPSSASARRSRTASTTTSTWPSRSSPDDLAKLEKRMQEIVKAGQTLPPPRVRLARRGQGRAGRRAVQAGAGRHQGRRGRRRGDGGRRRRADHLRQHRPGPASACWGDLCRGPHLPIDPADPGVQADALGRRVLAGQREEPAAAADLRHRVADPRRAQGVPEAAGGGRPPRPPQARRRPRPVLLPRRDRLRPARSSTPRAASSAGRWRTTRGRGTSEAGYAFVNTPHITKGDLFETSGHLPWYADTHVPAHGDGGRELLPQADELPVPQPDLPVARAVLPGAAAAAVRVRHGLPVREVRRGARPDPGPRHDPGRRAHLLHRGADGRRAQAACCTSCSTCCATTAWTTSTWSCPPATTRRSSSAPTRTGRRPPRRCARRREESGLDLVPDPGGAAFYGPKISRAGQGRDRPHLADVDHPGRLQPAGALRAGVPGGRRHPASSRS